MNANFYQTSPHMENGYTHTPLSTPIFICALITRLNYIPHKLCYKYNKNRKRKFRLKPYNSMVFKDVPFNLHIRED